jgi:sugar lactone lactonase YvrE
MKVIQMRHFVVAAFIPSATLALALGLISSCKEPFGAFDNPVDPKNTGLRLDRSADTIGIGQAESLTATITPSGTTDQNVTWSSDASSVATVSSTGLVTALAAGKANITATSADQGKTANCAMTVVPLGTIITIAGNGTAGFNGNNGPAFTAELNSPYGVAVDSVGNIYISDTNNNRIRKVDLNGIITTVAGTGTAGYSGDGGPATSAQLNRPYGLQLDSSGNLYIADWNNFCIRYVSKANGSISTIAGTGVTGYNGDGIPATIAQLSAPSGLAFDTVGNLFIVDMYNCRIRRIDKNTSLISTVVGSGTSGYTGDGGLAISAQIQYPEGVAIDSSGNLFIADHSNSCIRKVDTAGIITTIAGNGGPPAVFSFSGDGGPAASALLNYPDDVVLDILGNIYFTDEINNRVRKINIGGTITTIAGSSLTPGSSGDNGPATSALLYEPFGLSLDGLGNILLCDCGGNRIRKVFM